MKPEVLLGLAFIAVARIQTSAAPDGTPLAGTAPLTLTGDIASNLVAGVDRFLLRELDRAEVARAAFWHRDVSSAEAYAGSIEPNRRRLAHILGVRDARDANPAFRIDTGLRDNGVVTSTPRFKVLKVSWPAFADVSGAGLFVVPAGEALGNVIAIPDADQTPEQLLGLAPGVASESQFARVLAESGFRVVIPTLITRKQGDRKMPHTDRASALSHREFIYRSAFELGRHIIGYEIQKVLAAVTCLEAIDADSSRRPMPVGVIGWGEGGMVALYSGALDQRIRAVCVSGYFGDRSRIWEQPIDRNVFGLLEQFGDAELAAMIAPRSLVIEAARGPEVELTGKGGGAPARLTTPPLDGARREVGRFKTLVAEFNPAPKVELVVSGDGTGPFGSLEALKQFGNALAPGTPVARSNDRIENVKLPDAAARHESQLRELDRHNQALLIESPYVRAEFMKKLDMTSPEEFASSAEEYRRTFYRDVIGRFDHPLLPANARTRQSFEGDKWIGYEVVLDVFPDVFAYGILLQPKDLKPGEKRAVVVCQHGLEGRPQDIITGNHPAYHDFAAKLAERGFITFSPQNLYIFTDRFRTLQRKANPLGKTLFSIIVPQHQQITDWLKGLPNVDPARIAFYGLSYGGKTAMRVPPLVANYCLSICSADFNEWVWKNASTRSPYSYVWTGEYEIFEFDLGSTFNYAEMAALIAPRPFMVERGHFDGVAPDEAVGYEFAKVRHLYQARLGIGDRCEIEWFAGPHTINGKGTFAFLHKHLNWPAPPQ